MFGPEAGSLSADLTPVGPTGLQLEVLQENVVSGGFGSLQNIKMKIFRGKTAESHLHPDSILREDLQLRSVVWHKPDRDHSILEITDLSLSPVELLLVPVPLDAVQSVPLHLELADELDTLPHQLVSQNIHLYDLQTPQQTCKQFTTVMSLGKIFHSAVKKKIFLAYTM